jgi:hypothetical protein
MNREPFVNLFDVAGILMLCIVIAAVLAALGSKSITWGVVAVIGLVFAGAIYFAKRGAP